MKWEGKWLNRQGRVSRIHRKKPKGKPIPERTIIRLMEVPIF